MRRTPLRPGSGRVLVIPNRPTPVVVNSGACHEAHLIMERSVRQHLFADQRQGLLRGGVERFFRVVDPPPWGRLPHFGRIGFGRAAREIGTPF